MNQRESFLARAREALTDAQLEVVQQLGHGPVKVVAGAGSGKTTTMAWLYAAAVAGDLPVGRILAVTFTERAAAELRHKVRSVLAEADIVTPAAAADTLEGAWIGTFHQLVRRLLGERAYLAGLPRDVELLDPVDAGMVMQEALAAVRQGATAAGSWLELLPPQPDPRTVLRMVEGAGRAVERLRSTELDPAGCELQSLAFYRTAETCGDPPEQIAWHRAALCLTNEIWGEYEGRLAARGALDFDGLLREGLRALRRSPRLLGWCRNQFQLVIVDEYQDTSALQESLILEMTGPEQRSLFMVGDARQSIYAFRDAKPGIMAEAAGREFGLFRNHRSLLPILTAADFLIRSDPQFADDEPMEAARVDGSPLPVLVAEAADPSREAEAIAEALNQLHREGIIYPDRTHQALQWREMAVLAHTQGRLGPPLEEALRLRRIPFQTASGGLLERPEVKDLVAFLRLAADDQDDLACLRVLQCQVARIPDRALIALRPGPGERGIQLAARLRDHLAREAPGWEGTWRERAGQVLGVVESLRDLAKAAPAAEVLGQALAQTGLLQLQQARVRAGDPSGRRALSSLRELQRVAWAGESPARWLSLSGLLDRLAVMREEAKTAEPPAQTDEDLVTLSTVHRAKGLEWPVVVLADCRPYHPRGQDSVIWDRQEGAILCTRIAGAQTEAFRRWSASPAAAVARQEHRRLIYVAVTRARDLLLVTTSRPGKDGEFHELAEVAAGPQDWALEWPLFGELGPLPWAPVGGPRSERGPADSGPPARTVSLPRLAQRWAEIERLQDSSKEALARPSQLSFTAIDVLTRCPRQFWYGYLAHFPEPSPTTEDSTAAPGARLAPLGQAQARDLGIVVHEVLERLHHAFPDRAATVTEALAALELARDALEPESGAAAEEMLRQYVAGPTAALPTLAVEFSFSWSGWAGPQCPPLVGVIDRIARLPSGELLIIDYKTNVSLDASELAGYSRQLQLYAAAVAAGVMGVPVRPPGTALAMLRSGELLTVRSGPEEIRDALTWAAAAARRVELGDYRSVEGFPTRPCAQCPFVAHCPERRPGATPGLVRQLEEP